MNDLDFALNNLKESNKKLRKIRDKLKDSQITEQTKEGEDGARS